MPCVEHRLLRELEHTVYFEGSYIVYNENKKECEKCHGTGKNENFVSH